MQRVRSAAERVLYRMREAGPDGVRTQLGRVEARMTAQVDPQHLLDSEFQVFSQFGEDGIIEFLVRHVPIDREVFVEFGVANYRESNTRFLLVHRNWRGLIIDGGRKHEAFLRMSGMDWRYQIDALSAFISRDNINSLIEEQGVAGDIGLLSVDIDGNDYWVLEAIDVVHPRILIVEYNSLFGPRRDVSVPYDPTFTRFDAHYSGLYWGASLRALTRLAASRGFALVAGNSAGNNAFFVRSDLVGALRPVSVEDAWRPARFRESRDEGGHLSFVQSHQERLNLIHGLPLWDFAQEATILAGDLASDIPGPNSSPEDAIVSCDD
jgi:hypothetical protein